MDADQRRERLDFANKLIEKVGGAMTLSQVTRLSVLS